MRQPVGQILDDPPFRGRIGVIVPSVNTVVESWYPHVAPQGVSVHTGRMLIGQTVTVDSLREMDLRGVEAAIALATARPGVIIYGCTASSLVGGRAYDLELMTELGNATGCPSLTTTECVLRALHEVGARTVAVASPYTDDLGNAEVSFLAANGHPVLGHQHLGISGGFELAAPTSDEILKLARRAWGDAGSSADALFIGCMNLGSHTVIEALEQEIGHPVITSTQAAMWCALREIGVTDPVPGYGRLLHAPS
jgi:maleate isomerase